VSAPTGQQSLFPFASWPTKTYSGRSYPMYLNGDGIQVLHTPAAHSDGDSIVFFRRADVIVTGDILDITRFPVIDVEKGGSIQGEIDALNRLVEMTVPPFPLAFREDRTYLIPGHGFVCDYSDLVQYRTMVIIIRDRIQDMLDRNLTLPQVKAADPAQGFKGRYGREIGPWTTNMFIDAVYTSLVNDKKPR
jgi:glyoxylase-like metal-dependent hydrolase (beta-lactamase superfamily II)